VKKSEVTDAACEVGLVSTGFGMISQSRAGERRTTSARQALSTKPQGGMVGQKWVYVKDKACCLNPTKCLNILPNVWFPY